MKRLALQLSAIAILLLPTLCWARAGGGCFLPESQILKADSTEIPIHSVKPGDKVLAFTSEAELGSLRQCGRTKGDRLLIRSLFFSERKKRSIAALLEQLPFRLMLMPATPRHHSFMKS